MRGLGFLIVAMLPGAALAEPVVLRIEAQRSAAVAPVAEGWAGRFPDVMTFPLPGGWTGIGLGPMEREAAEAELARLRASGEIPGDSFIVPVPEGAQPVQATAAPPEAEGPSAAGPAPGSSTFVPSGAEGDEPATPADTGPEADEQADAPETAAVEPAPAPPAGDYLRLQRFDTREAADAALASWREDFPEAGLFQQPDGGLAIALGPMPAEVAEAWLGAFRTAQRVGRFAAVLPPADLGQPLEPAEEIDLPAPGPAAEMPPLEDIQRALRWAGHYDGEIDGKDGPQTRAAIAAEVLALRASPDPAATMQALIAQREDWREDMNLTRLDDPQSGLSLVAPMDRLQFDRNEQGLSIYGPRDGSGAALILYGAPGGQQEMLDFTGLVTALGWVPSPERQVARGRATLVGRNDTHIGQAEARVADGRVQGMVLIWPVMDAADQPRVAAEILDSIRVTPAAEPVPEDAPLSPDDPA
ncbi:peptidoglycan-binding domain-containing protein [Paracoccus sp. MC1862]|uniref:peptidoglycan-binding domain-containing protein n=1 Tax=Paracoccus sp. MC1862 TaxID=2760307 RepID=UPI0016005A26|nr:peptidoglycan-binding domain-containing protein [Paracoccus sp. MC1862]MBB1496978.1 peptidoglycan-binding protein [Paracoccus sp. MC1862]QQO44609.1 peptidoglycan-binding protein [Paracoccus sp. MC1862]